MQPCLAPWEFRAAGGGTGKFRRVVQEAILKRYVLRKKDWAAKKIQVPAASLSRTVAHKIACRNNCLV